MHIKGIGWVGVRAKNYSDMVDFCRDVLGLKAIGENGDFAKFAAANGDRFEIFGRENPANPCMPDLAIEFLVDEIEAARAELERHGIEFLISIKSDGAGMRWTHFRAPNGRLYGLVSRD